MNIIQIVLLQGAPDNTWEMLKKYFLNSAIANWFNTTTTYFEPSGLESPDSLHPKESAI
jgi:hypothetical protein